MTTTTSTSPEFPGFPKALKVVNWPHPALKKQASAVIDFSPELQDFARMMLDLMRAEEGVGLAAPQVGISIRMFVMNHTGDAADDSVYVNPKLTLLEGETESEEGCLSLPAIRIDVTRTDKVRIEAFDLDGRPVVREADGFEARVWQHESDHLDGILLTDRMGFSDKMRYRRKLKDLQAAFTTPKKK